jgi:hypothetical protein
LFVRKKTYDSLAHDYANLVMESRALRERANGAEKSLAEQEAELSHTKLLLSILEGEMADYSLLVSDVLAFLNSIPETITSGRGGRRVLRVRDALSKRIEGLVPKQEEKVEEGTC